VVPHWNNAEGGTHDTSRCWLGARRFAGLAAELPPGLVILGVDEHTAVVLDFDAGRLEVAGKGTLTRIAGAESAVLGPGDTMPLSLLPAGPGAPPAAFPATRSLAPEAAVYEQAFAGAIAAGDRAAALDAILSLEDAHQAWDPAVADAAHDALRAMATRFAAVVAAVTPDDTAPSGAVEALLGVRSRARADGRWADADAIRRALRLLAVEVRDTPEGTVWRPAAP
jgi:hypothetical protein